MTAIKSLPLSFWKKTGWNTKAKPEGYQVDYDTQVVVESDDSVSVNGVKLRDPVSVEIIDEPGNVECRRGALLKLTFNPYDGCPIDMSEGVPMVGGKLVPLIRISVVADPSGISVTLLIHAYGWKRAGEELP